MRIRFTRATGDMSLRHFWSTRCPRTDEMHALFTGGGFGETYNDKYELIVIDIPADAAASHWSPSSADMAGGPVRQLRRVL